MAGWIKLHRDMTNHWIWEGEPFTRGQAWIDLLLWARHSPGKTSIDGKPVALQAGQQARSEVTLAKTWGWSRGKVRRFLEALSSDGMIVQQTNNRTSIITVCNYRELQGDGRPGDDDIGTADEHQIEQQTNIRRYTIEEGEEGKKGKKGKNKPSASSDARMDEAFEVFWKAGMRKAGKEPARQKFAKAAKGRDPIEFAEMLAADVTARLQAGQLGFDKLMPATYLHQRRWEDESPSDCPHDEIVKAWNEEMPEGVQKTDPAGWTPSVSGHARLVDAWEGMKQRPRSDGSGPVVQDVDQGAKWFRAVFRRLAKSPRLQQESTCQWCKLSWAVKRETIEEIAQGGFDG